MKRLALCVLALVCLSATADAALVRHRAVVRQRPAVVRHRAVFRGAVFAPPVFRNFSPYHAAQFNTVRFNTIYQPPVTRTLLLAPGDPCADQVAPMQFRTLGAVPAYGVGGLRFSASFRGGY